MLVNDTTPIIYYKCFRATVYPPVDTNSPSNIPTNLFIWVPKLTKPFFWIFFFLLLVFYFINTHNLLKEILDRKTIFINILIGSGLVIYITIVFLYLDNSQADFQNYFHQNKILLSLKISSLINFLKF